MEEKQDDQIEGIIIKVSGFNVANKLLALLLAVAMVLPMFPAVAVRAAEAGEPTQIETVTVNDSTISRTAVWDFSAASQLADFSLYQSGTSTFTVSDGMLVPNGADGELKAILTNSLANVRSVSVDMIPGASGLINAGLYVGSGLRHTLPGCDHHRAKGKPQG